MKYTFKQVDNISGANAVTSIEFDADFLPDILQHFEMFLRGSGFHPSGTLDFVDESWADDCPQFEPAEEHYEEAAKEVWPFPLQKQPVMQESIYEDGHEPPSGSVVMDWTAAQLIRPPQMKEVCPVCKIDMQTMSTHDCWDNNCPKGKDAN
jgi:hypothetical protein